MKSTGGNGTLLQASGHGKDHTLYTFRGLSFCGTGQSLHSDPPHFGGFHTITGTVLRVPTQLLNIKTFPSRQHFYPSPGWDMNTRDTQVAPHHGFIYLYSITFISVFHGDMGRLCCSHSKLHAPTPNAISETLTCPIQRFFIHVKTLWRRDNCKGDV